VQGLASLGRHDDIFWGHAQLSSANISLLDAQAASDLPLAIRKLFLTLRHREGSIVRSEHNIS
jgi:hypothetical protein